MAPERRDAAKEKFLDAFAQTAIILVACRSANINRTTVDYWKDRDPDFRLRFRQAEAEANDRIDAEIHRRAIQGVRRTKGVYYKGNLVGSEEIVEYSDTLLIFLAKARMPDRYRDNVHLPFTQHHPEITDDEVPYEMLMEVERMLYKVSTGKEPPRIPDPIIIDGVIHREYPKNHLA